MPEFAKTAMTSRCRNMRARSKRGVPVNILCGLVCGCLKRDLGNHGLIEYGGVVKWCTAMLARSVYVGTRSHK